MKHLLSLPIHARRRRGAALIMALLISTLLAIIVIEFVYSTSLDLRQAKRFTDDAQETLAVEAALMYARILLEDDNTRGRYKEIDTLEVPLEKTDIKVTQLVLAWVPTS